MAYKKSNTAVAVEHRPVAGLQELTFTAPMPPSLNNCFFNVPGRGRVPTSKYAAWRIAAGMSLNAQRVRRIDGPVHVEMVFGKSRADLDNLCKPSLDLAVTHGVIDGDGPTTVKSIKLAWGDCEGVKVTIRRAA